MVKPTPESQGRAANRRRAAAGGPPDPAEAPGGDGGGGRAAARRDARTGRKRRRRGLRVAGIVTGCLVLVAGGGGFYLYEKLNGNIQGDSLTDSGDKDKLHEKADAFGRTPINILMIGSDARTTKADCKIGGACDGGQGGARADVEMVMHISADRSNSTVVSIPRDLMTDLPGCVDSEDHTSVGPRYGMINTALGWRPGCSVHAIEKLTKIPIDHFMMVDFSGVVKMADAVGGVPVCVKSDIYDPYSGLKLKAGTHTLQDRAALEFLRTRHGWGGGTDPGRTVAQHVYLTNLINQLKNNGTMDNPIKLASLADAATKALRVDNGPDGIDSVTKLVGLGEDINKVPPKRITFTTMQTTEIDSGANQGRLLLAPGAEDLFRTIAADQSLTTASGKKSAAAASATAVPVADAVVTVQNGTGVPNRAGVIAQELIDAGFSRRTAATNGTPSATTTLTYPAADQPQAKAAAKALGLPSSALKQGTGPGMVLLIGADWRAGDTFPGGKKAPAAGDTSAALNGSSVQKGNQTGVCLPVGTNSSLIGTDGNGHFETDANRARGGVSPGVAYTMATAMHIPDSAP